MFDPIIESESDKVNNFSDSRLKARYEKIKKQLELGQSCVMNKVSSSRSERKGSYDFFKNPRVEEGQIKSSIYNNLDMEGIKSSNLLVIQDTSDYNFARSKSRIKNPKGLGDISNKYGLGYIVHPSLVINQADDSILGLSDLQLWNREKDRSSAASRKQRRFENKESYKWHLGILNSHKRLRGANQVTYVQDRDGDLYESIVRVKSMDRAELLVRNSHDRRIELSNGERKMLYDYLSEQEILFSYELRIKGDKRANRSSRIARLDVRSVRVKLICPVNLKEVAPPSVEVDIVWVRENESSIPRGEDPVDWKLTTTHQVHEDQNLILQLIKWYVSRWKIEEFFLSPKQEHTI